MPKTKVEKLISHQRRRGGVLVPLLEDLFMSPVEPEDQRDIDFITMILQNQIMRQQMRQDKPMFSPSQLAECLRYVYLLKHHKELGISRQKIVRVEPHFYFFNGNFLHLKWQFALHKLDRALPDNTFKLLGVEVPIVSKRGDHGGTVDALCLIYDEPIIVDFKGLNVRTFGEITRGYVPAQYTLQIGDYGMLYNSQRIKRINGAPEISRGLLVSENKGGPDTKHLVALHETEVVIETQLPEVRSRLKRLRTHAEENSIPPPECQSTTTFQFQGCPFRNFCKEEVKAIARKRRDAEGKDSERLAVAVPEGRRDNRSGRNSTRRRSRTA